MESSKAYEVSTCEFEYQSKQWSKKKPQGNKNHNRLYRKDYWRKTEVPIYAYVCYCSSLELKTEELHEKYTERSTSENWIEQVKNQSLAGRTLTNDFHANDLLWQLDICL